MDQLEVGTPWPISAVYLLHGKGGSPEGTVKKLHTMLEQRWPGLDFIRPLLPHHNPQIAADITVEHLLQMQIPSGALVLGISLGGLVAAKVQEYKRDDLKVLAISSPTWADGVHLERLAERRLAFYSSNDEAIAPRVANWPKLASIACDFEWLTHDSDQHLRQIARLFDWFLEGMLLNWLSRIRNTSLSQQERDEIVWKSMAEATRTSQDWTGGPWSGGRPRTFAEMGDVMQSGKDWEYAFSDWSHAFVCGKDPRCLAQEPPSWFPEDRRAMLAGLAEFFSVLYGLRKPPWINKPEYFLSEPTYFTMLVPDTEDGLHRLRARTPKELLRRNVIFEARGFTVL